MGDGVFRIVVGVDRSVPSRLALEWAVAEARLRHGQVRVVTAWEFPPVTAGMEGLIQARCSWSGPGPGPPARSEVSIGPQAEPSGESSGRDR